MHIQLKLRMEMGNVSKRQPPGQRAENSRRQPMGLKNSEKIQHPEACFSWHQTKICTSSVIIDVTNSTL